MYALCRFLLQLDCCCSQPGDFKSPVQPPVCLETADPLIQGRLSMILSGLDVSLLVYGCYEALTRGLFMHGQVISCSGQIGEQYCADMSKATGDQALV